MLANSTEYQHAIEEDAKPTGWLKLMQRANISIWCGSEGNGTVTVIAYYLIQVFLPEGKGFVHEKLNVTLQ